VNAHWTQRPEGGGHFALSLIRFIGLHLGRGIARIILYPITIYFFFRRVPERRASRAFLSRISGHRVGNWLVLKHIHRFAGTILDRVFLLSDNFRQFDIRVHGLSVVHDRLRADRGMLVLGSHLGSFEVLRVLSLHPPQVRVKVLMDQSQSPALTALLNALNPQIATTVIDATQDSTAVVLALSEASDSGALIALLGDRARPGEATLPCAFFGDNAPFPTAPMLIASILRIPVVLCFGLYRGGNRYDLHFELFSEQQTIPRATRQASLAAALARYAQRLEHYTRIDPYNWFNFYDFWNADGKVGADSDAAGLASGKPGT
jgi:predicted LPLAT superfamily acyltransferase